MILPSTRRYPPYSGEVFLSFLPNRPLSSPRRTIIQLWTAPALRNSSVILLEFIHVTPSSELILLGFNREPDGNLVIRSQNMPRPSDHYTHAQFEPVESDFQGETVRCVHCKHWSGSVKTLNRKKDHLMKCRAYAAWRAAGNGQDLPPPNKYNKRDSSALNDDEE